MFLGSSPPKSARTSAATVSSSSTLSRRKSLRLPTQSEMTQAPPGGRDGSSRGDGLFRRREQRVALLAHASQAIHRAQTSAQEPGKIRTVAELVTLTRLEAHTLAEVELEAMQKLEADVRRFAEALRS